MPLLKIKIPNLGLSSCDLSGLVCGSNVKFFRCVDDNQYVTAEDTEFKTSVSVTRLSYVDIRYISVLYWAHLKL